MVEHKVERFTKFWRAKTRAWREVGAFGELRSSIGGSILQPSGSKFSGEGEPFDIRRAQISNAVAMMGPSSSPVKTPSSKDSLCVWFNYQ